MTDVTLDVRPILARGEEPFDEIMSAVSVLREGERLLLIASFEPKPLFRVMERKGFTNQCRQVGPDEYHVLFARA